MDRPARRLYKFGPFTLNEAEKLLLRDGKPVPLTLKPFQILLVLVQRSGHLVGKTELIELVWPNIFIEETTLSSHISTIRKTLGEDADHQYIKTVSGRGFRFVDEVKESIEEVAQAPAAQPVARPAAVADADAPAGADPASSPYIGPAPYTEERAADFFGRSEEVTAIMGMLFGPDSRKRVVLLYSPSGAGKTSLINAGLRPELKDGDYHVLPTARVRVTADPVVPGQNPYTFAAIASMEQEDDTAQYAGAVTWAQYLATKRNQKRYTLLVIDQLEEIMTTRQGKPQRGREREAFFIELREALAQNPSLRVLLAFRQESLADIEQQARELSEFWSRYQLTTLPRKAAKAAISLPAKRRGVEFEPEDVLDQLVGILCDDEGEFVEPMLLQLVCGALWRNLTPRTTKISWRDLQLATLKGDGEDRPLRAEQMALSFVDSILQDFCEQVVGSASAAYRTPGGGSFPVELLNLGCLQFISEQDTRTLVRRGKTWTGELPNTVADALARQQFLRVENRHRECWYELAHDTLIRPVIQRASRVDDDALMSVFSNAVQEAAASAGEGAARLDEATIEQECCVTYVAEDGSPLKVPLVSLEDGSGRLPLPVVEALARRGILRRVSHQEQEVYELSHPLLARAIHRKRFRGVSHYYRTRKGLETFLEEHRASGAPPAVWYQRSDKSDETVMLLENIEDAVGADSLTEREANFVLRASLGHGHRVKEFATGVGGRLRGVAAAILQEATRYDDDAYVRENAARALGFLPLAEQRPELIRLALKDPDESVRKAAAKALTRFEYSGAWDELFSLLDAPSTRQRALTALAWMHDAVSKENMRHFEERRMRLPRPLRSRLRSILHGVRWRDTKDSIILAGVVALASTVIFTVPPRALLATADWTTTQANHTGLRATMDGVLNGIFGVVAWSIFIGGGLLVWWHIAEGRRPWRGRFSPHVGAAGGLLGGIVNTFVLVLAYSPETLYRMGWLPWGSNSQIEVLTQTGAALLMPVYGLCVGWGCGLVARRMLSWWESGEPEPKRIYAHTEIRRALVEIIPKVLLNSWMILAPLVCGAVLLGLFLTQMPHKPAGLGKLLGEALSIFFGGFGLLVGLFLGLHILRKGFSIASREE